MTQANEPSSSQQLGETVAETNVQAKRSGCGVAVLLVIGLAVVGILLATATANTPRGTWSRLDLGQAVAVSILGADDYEHPRADHTKGIYIGTRSGDVYACWMDTGFIMRPDRCVKETIQEIPQGSTICPTDYATPTLPGEVVDSGCAVEGTFSLNHIIILKDGSAWMWTKSRGEY